MLFKKLQFRINIAVFKIPLMYRMEEQRETSQISSVLLREK